MSLTVSQSLAPERSLSYFERQTAQYSQMLQSMSLSLRFTPSIEKSYQEELSTTFLQENARMLILGMLCYAVFAVLDYFVYPEAFVQATVLRFSVLSVHCFIIYFGSKNIFRQQMVNITTFALILAGLQIIVSSSYLETPSNLAYIAGILPLFVYMLSILRYSFVHTAVCSLVLLAAYTAAVMSYNWETPGVPELTKYISQVAPAYIAFLATISVIGIFMTYAVERAHRRKWLRTKISDIKSEQLSYLSQELQQLTVTDGLTGLKNRRFFDQQLHYHWDASAEASLPLALIMIDVDWFKPYNDNYGHQKGDECLKSIATLMKNACEDTDAILTRYGGEEFFIILPHAGLKTALSFAESLRTLLYERNIRHDYSPMKRCTMSIGVGATIPESVSLADVKDKAIAVLLKEIDDALYAAKANGKNQVCAI